VIRRLSVGLVALSLIALSLLALCLFALAACSGGGSSLEGTQWRLTDWTLSSLDPVSFTITAQFSDGSISGSSGVNTYNGGVTLGSDGAFSVGTLATTLMAGPDDAMRAEGAYMTLLAQAKSYKVADDTLTLYDEGGNESLIFEAEAK
jgi:heat shock protein HslJ